MKNIIKIWLSVMSVLALVCACEPEASQPEGPDTPSSDYYEFPLDWEEDGFAASDNGVSINVSELKEQNIVFNVVPGAAVKSYRVDVYPKAMLYNLLLNEKCVGTSAENCEDKIINLLTTATGACSYVFNSNTDDFAAKEFDWANTTYTDAVIVPDCDYFILALACYDADGKNPASLSIAHVVTPAKELVGDPQIGIEAEVGYRAFIVRYHPNEDCKYFYHWIWSTEEIGEYIDLFGEKMMGDFCRTSAYAPNDATLPENLAVKRSFDASSDIIKNNTAVAVALDANMTPAAYIMRSDFELRDIPEGEFEPKAHIKAGERIGATVAFFDVELEKNCMSCFYRVYKKADADALKAASADAQKSEAISLAVEGWGVANPRFSIDTELGKLTGSAFKTSDESQLELEPDTEYVVVYVAKNYFAQLSDLCFSESFRTKPLVRNNPQACVADVELTLSDVTRWGFKYNFKYDYDKTMCYRFQIVWPYIEDDPNTTEDDDMIRPPHYINDAENFDKWVTFFYDTFSDTPVGKQPIANLWLAEKSGADGYSMYGYESGITYVIAYCAEDVNGVVGPVKFAMATTTEPTPGPDPVVTLEDLVYDEELGEITGRFVANADTKTIKYFGVTSSDATLFSSCALNDLVNGKRRDYNAYMTLWESQLIQLGLSTTAESVAIGINAPKNSDVPVLVAAVAIGEDNGVDCYSPIAAKIYHKGEFKDLSDYRTPPAAN